MSTSITPATALTVALVAAAAVVAAVRRDVRPFAVVWAAFLPIDVVTGVEHAVFDVIRYGGAVVLVLCVRPEPRVAAERRTIQLAWVLVALAVTRVLSGLAHDDRATVRYGLVLAMGAAIGVLLVRRRSLLPAVTTGFLAGLALSAAVSLMQAMDLPTLAEGNTEGSRYPGLASYTTWFTWQIAVGLIIAVYLVATRRRTNPVQFRLAVPLVPLFALAMLTNGAQGGVLGLAAALIAVLFLQRDRISLATAATGTLAAVAVLMLGIAMVAAFDVEVPTLTDYLDSDFRNENARIQTFREGIDEFTAHPLTGMSSKDYAARYGQLPHFLPIESGALSGVAGLAVSVVLVVGLGWLVFRRPDGSGSTSALGHALLASMFVSFFTGPQGPVLGLVRVLPLMAAILLAGSGPGRAPRPAVEDSGAGEPVTAVEDPSPHVTGPSQPEAG